MSNQWKHVKLICWLKSIKRNVKSRDVNSERLHWFSGFGHELAGVTAKCLKTVKELAFLRDSVKTELLTVCIQGFP